jgi:hypothetical protein
MIGAGDLVVVVLLCEERETGCSDCAQVAVTAAAIAAVAYRSAKKSG